jgi:hypothetical protein
MDASDEIVEMKEYVPNEDLRSHAPTLERREQ